MGESIPLAAPVPVEQAVLETFFSHLGIFSYDKAKDNVEKEREANKSAGGSWLSLLAALAHLAAAEKVYHSLTYLGQKLGTSAPPPMPLEEERKGIYSPIGSGLGSLCLSLLAAGSTRHFQVSSHESFPSLGFHKPRPPASAADRLADWVDALCKAVLQTDGCIHFIHAWIGAINEKLNKLCALALLTSDNAVRGAKVGSTT